MVAVGVVIIVVAVNWWTKSGFTKRKPKNVTVGEDDEESSKFNFKLQLLKVLDGRQTRLWASGCRVLSIAIQNVPRRQHAEKHIAMQRNGGGVKSLYGKHKATTPKKWHIHKKEKVTRSTNTFKALKHHSCLRSASCD